MAYASAPFTVIPNAANKLMALPPPYNNMVIKEITLDIIKPGTNDARGTGHANSTHKGANFTVSNSTTRKSAYTNNYCVYIQEFNGSAWVDKVLGNVDLSTPGEMLFSFPTYRDSNYFIMGVARGEI